jgi:hypothetical protein
MYKQASPLHSLFFETKTASYSLCSQPKIHIKHLRIDKILSLPNIKDIGQRYLQTKKQYFAGAIRSLLSYDEYTGMRGWRLDADHENWWREGNYKLI